MHEEGISTPCTCHKGRQPLIECARHDFKTMYFPLFYVFYAFSLFIFYYPFLAFYVFYFFGLLGKGSCRKEYAWLACAEGARGQKCKFLIKFCNSQVSHCLTKSYFLQRVAESLDADVKRWSSGKTGNLRALLSTLQYVCVNILNILLCLDR